MSFFGQILAKVLSGIIRHEQREPEQIHALVIRGIDTNLTKIKWARIHSAHARPRFAPIFRTKNSAALTAQIVKRSNPTFITLHHRHDDFWIAGADCKTDSASLTGKTSAKLFPGSAAVGALKNSADVFAPSHAWATSETPRRPLSRIQRGVKNLRIRRVECDITTARLCIVGRQCVQDQ